MHNRGVNRLNGRLRQYRHRWIDTRTLRTHRKHLAATLRSATTLLGMMDDGVAALPQSRYARFDPESDSRRPDFQARSEVWSRGLSDLYLSLRTAIDSTRGLMAMSRHSRGIGLAPLSLSRTVMEAASDTYLKIGVDLSSDPTPRFYAGWLRQQVQENDSFEWMDRHVSEPVEGFKEAWPEILSIGNRLGIDLQYGNTPRMSSLIGPLPSSIRTFRGKTIQLAPARSSTLGGISAKLLQSWRLSSGAAHASSWLARGEFGRVDEEARNPDPWIMAINSAEEALDYMCVLNLEFLGWNSESYKRQS